MTAQQLPPEDEWISSRLKSLDLRQADHAALGRLEAWISRHEFAYDDGARRRFPLASRIAAGVAALLIISTFAVFNFERLSNRHAAPAVTPTTSPSLPASPSPTFQVATPGPANPPPFGSWRSIAGMSQARDNFTATLLPNGLVLVVGGVNDVTVAGTATPAVEIYDPSTQKFTPVAAISIGRAGHTATLLRSGKVLVVGGYTQLGSRALSSVEIFDPGSMTWATAAPLLHGRAGHVAALLADGRVLVTGGSDYPPVGISPHGSAPATLPPEIYDPATDSWKAAAMPEFDRPVDPTATVLSDGRVLVVGGQYMWNSPDEATEWSEVYDPVANTWSGVRADPRFTARQYQSATLLASGRVLIAGGSLDLQPTSTSALYDPTSNSWIELPDMSQPRCAHAATLLTSGRVLVAGSGCWTKETNGVDEFDPATDRWYPIAGLGRPRGGAVAVGLLDGTVLLMGGTQDSVVTTSAVIFGAG